MRGWYYLSLADHLETVQTDKSNKNMMVKGTFRDYSQISDSFFS